MTRAEAIELAAVAIHKVDGNAVPWEMEEDWMRDDYVKEATAALDALLEAGMTFGEDEVEIGRWHSAKCVFVAGRPAATCGCSDDRCGFKADDKMWQPVFVHRPQGESK